MNHGGIGALCAVMLAATPALAGSYTVTNFQLSGATNVEAAALDDNDDVVGTFTGSDNQSHGFYWSNGVVTQVDYPNAAFTRLYDVNQAGLAAGVAHTGAGTFVITYDVATGTFKAFKNDAAKTGVPTGINAAGTVVGEVGHEDFELTANGKVKNFLPKRGKVYDVPTISNTGDIAVGWSKKKKTSPSICTVYSGRSLMNLQLPGPGGTCYISPEGTVFGHYDSPAIGFVYSGGSFTSL